MKAILAMIMVVLVVLVGLGNLETAQAEGNSPLLEEEKQRILQATVRIDMAVGEVGINRMDGNALSSVVMLDGKVMVVTHNHWAQLLNETSTISLSTANNTLITTLTGKEFYAAILYQDAGTLLLIAPAEMVNYLENAQIEVPEVGGGMDFTPGTVVWSAYFHGKVGGTLDVRPMIVESGNEEQQPPVYRLRSLDGKPNQQGDSGSGIWWEGKLVGNLWAIIMEAAPDGGWQDTAISNAAVLTW